NGIRLSSISPGIYSWLCGIRLDNHLLVCEHPVALFEKDLYLKEFSSDETFACGIQMDETQICWPKQPLKVAGPGIETGTLFHTDPPQNHQFKTITLGNMNACGIK